MIIFNNLEQLLKMSKTIRTTRTADDYLGMSQHEHILHRPEKELGNMQRFERKEWIMDLSINTLIQSTIDLPESIIRTFLEILSNAGDNADASRRMGVDPGSIQVTMNKEWISLKSEGEPIPVAVKHDKSSEDCCMTVAEFIFGQLLTSSNYDDKKIVRLGAGLFGCGSKVVNIFSKHFIVKIGDKKNGIEQIVEWKNNMFEKTNVQCTPSFVYNEKQKKWITSKGTKYTGDSYVEIKWLLDFERFGYTEYPDEAFGLFAKYLLDYSLTCKIPVYFNNELYDVRSIKEYSKLLFTEEQCEKSIVYYDWENGKIPDVIKKASEEEIDEMMKKCDNPKIIPSIEFLILDTPDESSILSYVNGILTKEGGVHVNKVSDEFSNQLLEYFSKINPNHKITLKNKDVTPHFSMIINCRLPDPLFSGPTKTKLTGPKINININKCNLNKFSNWDLIARLQYEIESKQQRLDEKFINKGKGRIKDVKGEEANRAGSSESQKCILFLTEGESAESYAKKRIALLEGNKDFAGYFPLKGKVLNTMNASDEQFEKNKEIAALIQLIGLIEGIDYNIKENRELTRYGMILSTVDADSDGKHINLLLLNFFNNKYPTILKNGMFAYLLTPAVRLFDSKEKIIKRFYSEKEYSIWEKENSNTKYKAKFYKGLGTSEDADIIDDMTTAPMIICLYDEGANENFNLAFAKKNADNRKQWIEEWRNKTRIDDIITLDINKMLKQRNISDIINTDLIDYSLDVFFRAIPSHKDGLKKSQRQGLYYMLTKWNYGHSKADPMKVAAIASGVEGDLHYHHGEKSMAKTITKMGQNYIGSNNLNLFFPKGQFGSRHKLGKDAASERYIFSCPEWIVKYIFQKELVELVEYNYVEGDKVEPKWLPCDIPLFINGCLGIATGYSTFIPNYNPYDCISWILKKCKGNKTNIKLTPWYNKFLGKIEIKKKSKEENIKHENIPHDNSDEAEDEDEDETYKEDTIKGLSMKTYGKFEIIKSYSDLTYDISVTELPIGRSTHDYHNWLKSIEGNKKKKDTDEEFVTIKNFDDNSSAIKDTVKFTIYKFKTSSNTISHETLKLVKSYGISNMYLIDDNGYPSKYNTIEEILELYYSNMINVYSKLILKRISDTEILIEDLNIELKFVTLLVSETIKFRDVKKKDIILQMKTHKIPENLLNKIKVFELSEDEIKDLKKKIKDTELELIKIKTQTPEKLWSERLLILEKELSKRNYGINL